MAGKVGFSVSFTIFIYHLGGGGGTQSHQSGLAFVQSGIHTVESCFPCQCSQVLDTTRLVRSCVQGAVGMLRDQNESCARNMRRVTLLLGLLNEDNTRNGKRCAPSAKSSYLVDRAPFRASWA